MGTTIIITMLGMGVSAAVAEKVLNSFGKGDMANFCSIAGLASLGLTAIGLVTKLIQALTTLV